jgi:hypothetical protein
VCLALGTTPVVRLSAIVRVRHSCNKEDRGGHQACIKKSFTKPSNGWAVFAEIHLSLPLRMAGTPRLLVESRGEGDRSRHGQLVSTAPVDFRFLGC